jgi:GTPase SAR1 family protein
MIVGNKMDLGPKREVSSEEAQELAGHYDVPYMECSAKSGESVNDVFASLAKMMKQRIIDSAEREPPRGGDPIVPP